jgi:hypothetical protein
MFFGLVNTHFSGVQIEWEPARNLLQCLQDLAEAGSLEKSDYP